MRTSRGSTPQEWGTKMVYETPAFQAQAAAAIKALKKLKVRPDLRSVTFHPELAQYSDLYDGKRPPVNWPDFKNVPHSSMYREPAPMSQETKERLRGLRKRPADVGDEIAKMLREAPDLDGVYRVGAKFLGVKEKDLREKYGHLNPGQQRMNVGNKMRAKWRKEKT